MSTAALDMSKAFDKVNHYASFLKLMKRRVPVCLIKLLPDWYGKVYACVKWGVFLSKLVHLVTGVRQGGVLSPVLFTIYVNEISASAPAYLTIVPFCHGIGPPVVRAPPRGHMLHFPIA